MKKFILNFIAVIIGGVSFYFYLGFKVTITGALLGKIKPIDASIYLTIAIIVPIIYLFVVKRLLKLPILKKTFTIIATFLIIYLALIVFISTSR